MNRVRVALTRVLFPATALLLAPGVAAAQAEFGRAVLVTNDEILVGEPGNVSRPGIVYVYRRGVDGWVEHVQLKASDAFEGDRFGAALAASDDQLLIGATNQNDERGAAYVFQRQADGSWTEAARLVAADAEQGRYFGAAVAIAAGTALIGAPGSDMLGSVAEVPGAVYVFQRDETGAWSHEARIARAESDQFGLAIALGHDVAFISAPAHSENRGIVWRYERRAGAWQEAGSLSADELGRDADFGFALLLHENELLVSAPGPGGAAVFAFQSDAETGDWRQTARLQPVEVTPRDGFGFSLAYGDALLVGALGANEGRGAVFTFHRNEAGEWEGAARLVTPDGTGRSLLGAAASAIGGLAAFWLPGTDFGAGSVVIFEREASTGTWELADSVASPPESTIASVKGGKVRCGPDGNAAGFDCRDVELLAFLSVQDIGGGGRGVQMNDVWGWTDPETGREYVLAGRVDATAFVEITDPENPVYLGSLRRTDGSPGSTWRDIKVYEDHAYIVADAAGRHGIQVFDLTKLRDVKGAPVEFEMDAHYTELGSAHNIVINEETGFAYAVGVNSGGNVCGGGLHMIDIREPKQPKFAGCFQDERTGRHNSGRTHDAQCVVYRGPDERYRDRQICFNSNETALSIADVTDKKDPKAVGMAAYPNVGYSHQGWLDAEQRYFYMNDELDELEGLVQRTRTIIWDVSDLEDPRVVGEFLGETPATDHNLYIRGDLMYQSNYMAGLRIIDISDRENPREVAYFDTVPHGAQPGFAGSWSSYPFFESGVIAVTSMAEGLFLLKKRDDAGPVSATPETTTDGAR